MNKKNLILGVILVILISAAWGYEGPFKTWKVEKAKAVNLFSGIEFENVNQIELVQGEIRSSFSRINDKWKIDATKDFWLTQTQVDQIKSVIDEAKKTEWELVSQNKEKQTEFQTDESGRKVSLKTDGQELAAFTIGKMGPDYKSNYLSMKDSDKTFLVKASLLQAFGQEDWRDKTIFSTDKEKISRLRIHENGVDYIMDKKTSDKGEISWTIAKPRAMTVKKEKIDEVLAVLASLSAVEIPEQVFKGTGLDKNSLIIQMTGEGIDNTLMIGGAKKSNGQDLVFIKRGNSDNIYLITKEQKDKFSRKYLGI